MPIQNISIPKPCHENWNQMTSAAQGRHCAQCDKVVADFSLMSTENIIAHLAKNTNTCGKFGGTQLDDINRQLYLQEPEPALGWRKWLLAVTVFGSTLFFKANAQSQAAPHKVEQGCGEPVSSITLGKVMVKPAYKTVTGTVCDNANLPLPGVSIIAAGINAGTQTNVNGNFKLQVPYNINQLKAQFLGYKTGIIELKADSDTICNVKLEEAQQLMGEVVVIRPSFTKRVYYKYIRKPFRSIFGKKSKRTIQY